MTGHVAPDHAAVRFLSIVEKQEEAGRLVSEFIEYWQRGERVSVEEFLLRYPDLASRRWLLMDLLYEEYALRVEAGQSPDPEEFVRRFPALGASIRRQFAVEGWMHSAEDVLSLPARWPERGDDLHGCRIIGELGRGAFSRVYLAREHSMGDRLVALKVSPHETHEAQTLGRLSGHENIVTVHWTRPIDDLGLNVVCMEYAGGVTLADLMERLRIGGQPLPERSAAILAALRQLEDDEESATILDRQGHPLSAGTYIDGVLHIGLQLARALAHTHADGICHLDLKPSNVLITAHGTAKLLDFNLAFDPRVAERRIGGTLPYMAPEQLRAMGAAAADGPKVGERSDIFALGVILYEMLSGKHPFGEIAHDMSFEQLKGLLMQRHREGPIPLASVTRQVDRRLAALVVSCLADDPLVRPHSAEALVEALRDSLSLARRTQRKLWKRRKMVTTVTAAAIIAFAGLGYRAARSPSPADIAELGYQSLVQEDYREAVDHFTEALRGEPNDAALHYARGRAYEAIDEVMHAINDYKLAASLDTGPEAPARVAYLAERSGSAVGISDAAVLFGKQARDAGANSVAVYNNLGYSQMQIEKYVEARESFHQALELAPSSETVLCNLAVLLASRSDPDEASIGKQDWKLFHDAIQRPEQSPHVLLCASQVALQTRLPRAEQEEIAIVCVERAVRAGVYPGNTLNERNFRIPRYSQRFRYLISSPTAAIGPQPAPPPALLDPPTDGSGIGARFPRPAEPVGTPPIFPATKSSALLARE